MHDSRWIVSTEIHNQQDVKYKATLGTTSIVITIGTSLLLGCLIAFFLYWAILSNEVVLSIVFAFTIIGILALYLLTYLYRPIHYIVDVNHLIIKRTIRDVKIPIDEIKNAFIVRRESMKWTTRVGGNGGLFGFYGDFKNDFGPMKWYATKLGNYIMVETIDNNRIVITPDNTDMIKEIHRLLGKGSAN